MQENPPTLHTDRLILRRFALHDDKALFALLRDEEVNRFLPWWLPLLRSGRRRRIYSRFTWTATAYPLAAGMPSACGGTMCPSAMCI